MLIPDPQIFRHGIPARFVAEPLTVGGRAAAQELGEQRREVWLRSVDFGESRYCALTPSWPRPSTIREIFGPDGARWPTDGHWASGYWGPLEEVIHDMRLNVAHYMGVFITQVNGRLDIAALQFGDRARNGHGPGPAFDGSTEG
jgi:hypothetical protein